MKISQIILHQPVGLLRLLTGTGQEGQCTGVASSVSGLYGVASILLDSNPLDRERTWWAMKEPDGRLPESLCAAIDVALWDLSAKIAGRPLFRYVNGFRDRVPVCLVCSGEGAAKEIVQEAKEAQLCRIQSLSFSRHIG